jgi:alkylation response protein AidB-like acyl-CoA dehydrogenase
MDFNLSEENEQLRDAIRKWVDRDYSFARHRAIVQEGGFSRKAYSELVELGVAGLYVPETLGGLGMGPIEGMVVMEELGRGIVLEPFAAVSLVATSLLVAGNAPSSARWWASTSAPPRASAT